MTVSVHPPVPSADIAAIRSEFPILGETVRGKPLIYLDSAATSQKPRAVIDAITRYYATGNANIHRGVHHLSERATVAYDAVREHAARFLGAAEPREVIFTRGTTEGINLVAQCFARPRLRPGDEILITEMEHHSNIVPWQLACEQTGAVLRAAPITDAGELDLDAFERLITERTRLIAVVHISNALGTINPIARIAALARARGVPLLVDGAQAVPHLRVDVAALGCDFFVCSGHKLYGPTGIGLLYGRAELLEAMPPYQGGGDMIASVAVEGSTWAPIPAKFEAGTPHIAGVVGLGAALEWVESVGLETIAAWEARLLDYATQRVGELPGVRLVGTAREKASILAFSLDGIHPHDIGTVLDGDGIAIRAGHHCAQPVMRRFGLPATVRASFAVYNTLEEVDALTESLLRARRLLS